MFGLSLGKLLLLAAVIAFVWFGWRKLEAAGRALARQADRQAPKRQPARNNDDDAIDLVQDPDTGEFRPRNETRRQD